MRYDLALKRVRRRMNSDTMVLPTIKRHKRRRRTVYVAGGVLLPLAGFSGYMALTSGLGALVAEAGTAGGLPHVAVPTSPTSPASPASSSAASLPLERLVPPRATKPTESQTPPAPSISPPVPTPAPTKSCPPSPSPTATRTPGAGPTPTPAPSSSPTP